jgi:LysM repeat protein
MVSNQVLGARIAAGLLVLSVILSGCSSQPSRQSEPATPVTGTGMSETSSAPADEMTATEAAVNASPSTQVTSSTPAETGPVINPSAPKSYTVKRGDTLWGIASLFLPDPWLWPEVWYINPQVANPHRIYPGDTLALAYGADGRPQIVLEQGGGSARLDPRLRGSPVDAEVPIISYQAIAAFLSRPSILTDEQVKNAPYVLAIRDQHEVAGTGNEIYVRHLNGPDRARYSVVHVGDPLRDPDDGKVVGYQGIYTGTALVSKPGEVTKAVLIDTARETLRGDKVMPAESDTSLNFVPSAPNTKVHGRIIAVVDGTDLIGQFQVVAINRGQRDGLANGNVLAIDQVGESVRDNYANGGGLTRGQQDLGTSFAKKVKLPDERVGLLLVFRTFNRVSYALVLGATDTINLLDAVHNP